jgi:RNA processing factor Prp31
MKKINVKNIIKNLDMKIDSMSYNKDIMILGKDYLFKQINKTLLKIETLKITDYSSIICDSSDFYELIKVNQNIINNQYQVIYLLNDIDDLIITNEIYSFQELIRNLISAVFDEITSIENRITSLEQYYNRSELVDLQCECCKSEQKTETTTLNVIDENFKDLQCTNCKSNDFKLLYV